MPYLHGISGTFAKNFSLNFSLFSAFCSSLRVLKFLANDTLINPHLVILDTSIVTS